MNDQITLEHLRRMPMGEVAALDPVTLTGLQDQANTAMERAKSIKDLLDGVLSRRYADRAALLRKDAGKDFGSIRFDDGEVTITADLPKRPVWDQKRLGEIVERIRRAGEDPGEYVEVAYKVAERKFTAWPAHIRSTFEAARTVKPGKPSFKLSLVDREAAA
ncbi:MAG: hypothetical protein HQL52_13665 [Magnetococcales bacterium]|nr:hypothetical protein [Magnetococcales bacterium]